MRSLFFLPKLKICIGPHGSAYIHTRCHGQLASYLQVTGENMHVLAVCAQVIIACSIAYVWIVRLPNVASEFREYGLSEFLRTLVGAVKIILATLIFVAIWYPALATIPALLMAGLMACALIAHRKVRHAWQKYVPAGLLLVLSLFVANVYAGAIHR